MFLNRRISKQSPSGLDCRLAVPGPMTDQTDQILIRSGTDAWARRIFVPTAEMSSVPLEAQQHSGL
jgi:hypothetical protein